MTTRALLKLPAYERCEFEHNLITLAVCELRFPHLLEYETAPPKQLQKMLRKQYPRYETKTNVNVGPAALTREPRYHFASRNNDWTVSFRPFSISLETTVYRTYEDFMRRFDFVVKEALPILDTDFFLRVGLRYLNKIATGRDKLPKGWINDDLVQPLTEGVYGDVAEFQQTVRGCCDGGSYTFRHGTTKTESGESGYVLDADFSAEGVGVDQVDSLLKSFNSQNYNLFRWAIGEKALKMMGRMKPKAGRNNE